MQKRIPFDLERPNFSQQHLSGHNVHNGVGRVAIEFALTLVKNPDINQRSCSSCFVSNLVGGHVVLNNLLLLSFSVFICLLCFQPVGFGQG